MRWHHNCRYFSNRNYAQIINKELYLIVHLTNMKKGKATDEYYLSLDKVNEQIAACSLCPRLLAIYSQSWVTIGHRDIGGMTYWAKTRAFLRRS